MKDETLSGIITSELLFLYKMCWQGPVKTLVVISSWINCRVAVITSEMELHKLKLYTSNVICISIKFCLICSNLWITELLEKRCFSH